ncbi:UNVERIFIED_CONTAM: hypothetical protein FKN15_002662 [Acipenser sinensis]
MSALEASGTGEVHWLSQVSLPCSTEGEIKIVSGLKNTDVFVGEQAIFFCQLSRKGIKEVQWWLDGSPLQNSPFNKIAVHNSTTHTLTLKNLAAEDSGTVTFRSGSLISSAKLLVKDPTIEVVSPMEDMIVEEDKPVEFICQYTRPVQAVWKKNGRQIEPDGRRIVVEQDWNVTKLKINYVNPEDSGMYICEAEETRVVAHLDVQDFSEVPHSDFSSTFPFSCQLSR